MTNERRHIVSIAAQRERMYRLGEILAQPNLRLTHTLKQRSEMLAEYEGLKRLFPGESPNRPQPDSEPPKAA